MFKNSLRLCVSALALTTAMGASAYAQEQAQDSTEVEGLTITGTSIRGVAAAGSPTTSLSIEDLKAAGVSSATEAVRLLPQMLNFGADESRNSFTGTSGGGAAQDAAANATAVRSVNLRGVGPEATLLLVNGRRIPPSGVIKAISDLDLVATNALSRIEVVADGASAIYGADAVAGVVNLITRRPSDGFEGFVKYGAADSLHQVIYGLTGGKTWEGGGVQFAYESNFRTRLSGADRDFASQNRVARGGSDARSFLAAPGNITLVPTGATTGVPGAACTTAGATSATGTANCRRYALPAGNGVGVLPAQILLGGNRFDEAAYADLLPEQDRDSAYLTLRHKFTEDIEFWYEGFYSFRRFEQRQPPASGNLTVPTTNPWYVRPAGVPAGGSINVEYRLLDDGDADSQGNERTYTNAVGLNWDLAGDWRAEAYLNYGVDNGVQYRQSVLNNNVMRTALASSNPATAFNPFGDGTFNRTNNASLLDKIDAERNQFATSRTNDVAVKFDGPLFDISGGQLKLAVGAEYHDNTFDQALYASNVSNDGSITTKFVKNDRQVSSVFAEVFAPLVSEENARPGIQRLDLSLAARFDDYSDFGNTTNPKVGVIYEPIKELSLRATYGTSFRAPSLVDGADQILNIFIQNLTDPAATGGIRRGIFYNGGNSKLQPEEATTYTFGGDWEPEAVKGLRLGLTYYNIDYTDRIDVVPNTAFTNAAYDPYTIRRGDIPDAQFDALVSAFMASPDLQNPVEPAAAINGIIDGRRQNLGSMKQDGVDITIQYDFESDIGDWTVGFDVSRILNLERVTTPGTPTVDVLDTFGNPQNIRARGTLLWRQGPWAASGFINYTDGYINTAVSPNVTVDAFTTLDASVSYEFGDAGPMKDARIILSAQNLFDEEPPVVLNGTVSWDSQAASPMGRFISVEVSKRF